MSFWDKLKGVFSRMIGKQSIEQVFHVTPLISKKMQQAMKLWEQMYTDESPWLNENVHSLGLAQMIASEKARLATIEMEIKVTGAGEKCDFIKEQMQKLSNEIREQLEYGIAFGGLVIKPYLTKDKDDKYTLDFTYTSANNFYPLAFSNNGKITEAMFLDRIITKDKVYSKVEHHKLVGNVLTITNRAFMNDNSQYSNEDLGTEIALSTVSEWADIEPVVPIENVDCLLFAYFKMPESNNIDLGSPLGISGFSRAAGLIRNADEQYSNLLWEFEGSQLAIDVDRTALNPLKDKNGVIVQPLPKLQKRLFRHSLDLGEDTTYNVFSPAIRDKNIINGLNNILIRIEDMCALSRGTFSEVSISEARTATELKILKQRSYSANCDIQKKLEEAFKTLVNIIEIYMDLYEFAQSGNYEIAYKWDDSILVDKDAERQVDLLDVDKGLMTKVEYRVKWYGETEQQAEEALKKINEQKKEDLMITQSVFDNQQNNDSDSKTDAQASNDKLNRANESNKVTKNIQEAKK